MALFVFLGNRYLGSNRSIRPSRTNRFFRLFETFSISDETSGVGFSRALNRMAMLGFASKSIFCGRVDRFDHCEQINFGRLFETWSIFGETSDIGVFKDAESNDNILSSSNGIFFVESICSIRSGDDMMS